MSAVGPLTCYLSRSLGADQERLTAVQYTIPGSGATTVLTSLELIGEYAAPGKFTWLEGERAAARCTAHPLSH